PQPERRSDQVGVSTYLALTFGTLLSSQGTDASFVLTLSGFPPGASLRSCVSDSIRSFSIRFPVGGICRRLRAFARRPFDIHYVSRFLRGLIIESREFEFRHADMPNSLPLREVVGSGLAASGCRRLPYPGQAARATLRVPQRGVNFGASSGHAPDTG
ncbi:hypothetical protein E6R61_28240, partial [Streptomyces sp. LRa12]